MEIFLAILLTIFTVFSAPKGAFACIGHALIIVAFLGAITVMHING